MSICSLTDLFPRVTGARHCRPIAAAGSALQRGRRARAALPSAFVPLLASQEPRPRLPETIGTWALFLLTGFLLIVLFVLATWVVSRASRRRRDAALRRKRVPTPCEDVWAMHKVPEDIDWP